MEPIIERTIPMTKQAMKPLTRVPQPKDDDSTTCESNRQLLHIQIDIFLLYSRVPDCLTCATNPRSSSSPSLPLSARLNLSIIRRSKEWKTQQITETKGRLICVTFASTDRQSYNGIDNEAVQAMMTGVECMELIKLAIGGSKTSFYLVVCYQQQCDRGGEMNISNPYL